LAAASSGQLDRFLQGRFNLLSSLNNEDRLIGLSMVLTLGGISLGSASKEPKFLGYTALLVITILILGWVLTKSGRLAWLLIFGFVAGFLELWADWLHVTHLGSLVYTDYFGFRGPIWIPCTAAERTMAFMVLRRDPTDIDPSIPVSCSASPSRW
jgi:hypothetical protein